MSRFRHMLMIRYKDEVTEQQKKALLDGLGAMPEVMDFIRRYEFGHDLGNLGPGAPDLGLVADFDTEEDWRRYSSHPDHLKVIELVQEVGAELTRMQYLVE